MADKDILEIFDQINQAKGGNALPSPKEVAAMSPEEFDALPLETRYAIAVRTMTIAAMEVLDLREKVDGLTAGIMSARETVSSLVTCLQAREMNADEANTVAVAEKWLAVTALMDIVRELESMLNSD